MQTPIAIGLALTGAALYILPGLYAQMGAARGLHRYAPAVWAALLTLPPAAGWLAGLPAAALVWACVLVSSLLLPRPAGAADWHRGLWAALTRER